LIPALLFRRAWRGAMWLRCVATLLVLLPVALLGADEASPSATGLQLMKEHAAKGVRAAQWGAPAACALHHVHTGGARRPEPHCVGVRTSQRCLSGRRMLRASPSSCERRVLCSSRPTRMRIRNRVCVWVVKLGLAARVEKGSAGRMLNAFTLERGSSREDPVVRTHTGVAHCVLTQGATLRGANTQTPRQQQDWILKCLQGG
jgi:hypothetical protein